MCAIALLVAALAPPPQDPGTNLEKLALYKQIRSCTVKVYADMGNGEMYHGSGVAILREGDYDVIVTNAHVVGPEATGVAPVVSVKPYGVAPETRMPAFVLLSSLVPDEYWDVAFLIVRDPSHAVSIATVNQDSAKYVRVSDADPALNVYACGNPRDEEFLIDDGKTLVVHNEQLSRGVIVHDALIEHGNSGGGLFNGKGELIGINTWLLNENEGIAERFSNFSKVFRLAHVVASASADGWQETGLECQTTENGSLVRAMALGKWRCFGADFADADAAGYSGDLPRPFSEYNVGSLVMQVGSATARFFGAHRNVSGQLFGYPGARFSTVKDSTGAIRFRVNDSDLSDNSGNLNVFLLVFRDKPPTSPLLTTRF